MKYFSWWSFILCLILGSCSLEPPEEFNEDTTRAVLQHHWETFKEHNLAAVMADYTEESVLITPDTTYKGLDAIRENFKKAFATPKEQKTLILKKSVVEKDVGYIIWQASTPTSQLIFATDTFIIRDGKIIRQTFGGITRSDLKQEKLID